MSKVQKRATVHNPSPYMRRFQLPVLSLAASSSSASPSAYDELLSPLESESKHALIEQKNRQLRDYFGPPGASVVPKAPSLSTSSSSSSSTAPSPGPEQERIVDRPPPVPPHRPHPKQRLLELEKYRMCNEILDLERRSREMYDFLVAKNRQ